MLKDIAIKFNDLNIGSILIIDERGEFSSICGENIDKIAYSDKLYAFNYALRSLSPQYVITDELSNPQDWECVAKAASSGVKIIASCHSDNIAELQNNTCFNKNVFDRYIVLKNECFSGTLNYVYNKDFSLCESLSE